MMERYVIIRQTDAYHASRTAGHKGHIILRYKGLTPTEWIHDDNFGDGYTLEEARQILDGYYREDKSRGREGVTHKHFDTVYQSDTDTFRIVNENDL